MAVTTEQRGPVSLVRLHWPERRNALRPEDADEVRAAIAAQEADVVVLCGSPLAFCAGADLYRIAEIAQGGEAALRQQIYRSFQGLARAIRGFPGLVVSAVDGPATGLGADLALVCDACYVGTGGWMQQGWANVGAVPGIGGAWLTVRRAGYTAAWQFVLEQRRWTGPELEDAGLAVHVDGSAEEHAVARGQWLAGFPGELPKAYKSLFVHAGDESYEVHLERAGAFQARIVTNPAHRQHSLRVLEPREADPDAGEANDGPGPARG